MVDSLFLREQVKSIHIGRSKKDLPVFITEERAQKFDLLVHLVANLKQTLIVCGPDGIGKTTLLVAFKELKIETHPIVILVGTDRLSFELVQEFLWQSIRQQKLESNALNLIQSLHQLEKLNQQLVLIIDDAGQLVPGLMTSLVQYATMHPCIRLVFALTHDEIKHKSTTEHALEECHTIEIPALSLSQSKEYLIDLLAMPDKKNLINGKDAKNEAILNNAINDVMVKQIYKKTNGIPGKIVEELPNFLDANAMKGSSWIYILVFACAITVGVAALLWKSAGTDAENNSVNANGAGHSGTIVAPLNIPGQVLPPVQSKNASETTTSSSSIASVSDKSSGLPQLPEIKKSDYYTGYSRVREKDALDEYQANKENGLNQEAAAEQPKVEIIAPEPAPIPVQKVPDLVKNEADSLSRIPVITKSEPVQKPVVQSANSSPTADKSKVKHETIAKVKPIVNEAAKLVKNVQHPLNELKKVPVVKPEIKQPVIARSKNGTLEQTVSNKSDAQNLRDQSQQDIVEKSKIAPVAMAESGESKQGKQTNIEVENHAKPVVQESLSPSPIKSSKLDEAENLSMDSAIKAQNSGEKPTDLVKPSKMEANPADVVITNKVTQPEKSKKVVDEKVADPVGMARLGVVMKYQSDNSKAVKNKPKTAETSPVKSDASLNVEKLKEQVSPSAPTESISTSKTVNESAGAGNQKSTGATYTLQVMVFSQQQTLNSFMSKHGALGANLKYVTSQKDGSERYVVTYGSFNSLAEANSAKQKLPADFRQALARRR